MPINKTTENLSYFSLCVILESTAQKLASWSIRMNLSTKQMHITKSQYKIMARVNALKGLLIGN